MSSDRSTVVSSFTIVKGSMIEEAYAILAAWDLAKSKKENLDQLRNTNYIKAKSRAWLVDVAKVMNRRFDPEGHDRGLVALAKSGCNLDEWKPLLLWHMTRDEFLLKDFLIHWLFPTCYDRNVSRVQFEDLHPYLLNIGRRGGATEHAWRRTTLDRVAVALIRMATDFGLLKGHGAREFAPYQLPERSFIYLLHILLDKYKSPKMVINAMEWRMFLLCPPDVERDLLRLQREGKVRYDATGDIPQLSLPRKNAEEYAKGMDEVAPGDRCEVDYANDKIEWLDPKTGEIHQAYVFIGVMGFSEFLFAWASEDEKGQNWLQSHQRMFDAFGGVPKLTIYNCPKLGTKETRHGPNVNPNHFEIAAHYMTTVVPAKLGPKNDDTLVAFSARFVMRAFQFIYRRNTFSSISEINNSLALIVNLINRRNHSCNKISRLELWATQEKHALKSLPSVTFEAVIWKQARVHADCTVSFESAYYSAPHQHRGKKARIKVTATDVELFIDLERVAIHRRDYSQCMIHHVIPGHRPNNATAYREETPRSVLSQARKVSESLFHGIDELFAKDTLGNLRLAERLIRSARAEIKECGNENTESRIRDAVEEMQSLNDFRVHHFETTLRKLRYKSKNLGNGDAKNRKSITGSSVH